MAELIEYTSTKAVEGLQPTDLGVSAYEQMGRHIGLTARQLGETVKNDINEYEQHQAQQEISNDTSNGANAYLGATNDLDKYMSTPEARTNPNAASDWINNNLPKYLDTIGKDASTDAGKAHANELKNSLLMSLARTAHGYQSSVAGQNLQDNLSTSANILGQLVHDHPEMLEGALKSLGISLDNQIAAGTFNPEVVAKLRTDLAGPLAKQLATSAFQGAAEVNAPQALADLHSGRFSKYFSPTENAAMEEYAARQGKVNDELIRKQNKDAMSGDLAKVQSEIAFDDQGNATIPRTFYGDLAKVQSTWGGKPGAEDLPGQVRALADFAHTKAKEAEEGIPAKTDPDTYKNLTTRLTALPGSADALTATDIIRARAEGKLSDKDFHFIMESFNTLQKDPGGRIVAQSVNAFLKGMEATIDKSNPMMNFLDGQGKRNFYDFSVYTRAAVQQRMANGEKLQDILDDIRQRDLPKFIMGSKEGMDAFRTQIQGGAPNLKPIKPQGKVIPRNPGEDAGAYLKRTGQQ